MEHFNDPTRLTSIRYSAGKFLTRFDLLDESTYRMKLFLGCRSIPDQEVVGCTKPRWIRPKCNPPVAWAAWRRQRRNGWHGGMGGGMEGGYGALAAWKVECDGGAGSMGGYGGMEAPKVACPAAEAVNSRARGQSDTNHGISESPVAN